jgi:hypothetical protein
MRWVRLLLVIVFAALTFGGGSFECHSGSHNHDHDHIEEGN